MVAVERSVLRLLPGPLQRPGSQAGLSHSVTRQLSGKFHVNLSNPGWDSDGFNQGPKRTNVTNHPAQLKEQGSADCSEGRDRLLRAKST